jgi:hypothetical protein
MASDTGSGTTAPVRPNSSNALISLIAGILGLTFLPFIASIVAVVVGRSAKTEIAASAGALGGEGMAQAGIILGWIGIGLGVLAVCAFCALFILPFLFAGLGGLTNGFNGWVPSLVTLL